jgi:hypothetical protein
LLYTIGYRPHYEKALSQGKVVKLGRRPDYAGGSVWRTFDEAQAHCDKDHSVYGVDADWETDTAPSRNDWHDLLYDRPIVKLEGYNAAKSSS